MKRKTIALDNIAKAMGAVSFKVHDAKNRVSYLEKNGNEDQINKAMQSWINWQIIFDELLKIIKLNKGDKNGQ